MNHLWPNTASFDTREGLTVGGVAVQELARAYGTPLYIYDEATLRDQARAYGRGLKAAYESSSQIAYASKAYLSTAMAQIFEQEGLDLDVVSGGELFVALRAGFPASRIHFHGNNKSVDELDEALAAGVGRIVVDNFHELALVDALCQGRGTVASIWLRLAPGVQAHTHSHIQTGQEDTKFGFAIAPALGAAGDAEAAVVEAMRSRGVHLVGLHAHIGSQIYEPESLAEAAERLLAFAARMRMAHGFELQELSPGGGWGVPMVDGDPDASLQPYLSALCTAVTHACRQHGLELPHLVLEPGRSLVARAGVAVYTAGSSKLVPGIRRYVAVDGGMADNIRPALYGAQYAAVRVMGEKGRPFETITLAGKYCESGDILIRDIDLPEIDEGDLIAVPMAGAYTLAMASNYNLSRRPAVVLVKDGRERIIQRRETYADLVRRDRGLRDTDRARPQAFAKYDALGNDYLVLDPLEWPHPPDPATIRRLCDRHAGIGADGVLWGPVGRDPFALRLFNPDGGEFEKSGNGLRIFARYLWDQGLPNSRDFEIQTPIGPVTAHVLDDRATRIAMDMGHASFDASEIGLATDEREVIGAQLAVGNRTVTATAVSMGNPHCVIFEVDGKKPEDSEALNALAQALGPQLEYSPLYPHRTNVQIARVIDKRTIEIAIWERGAGYTLASGTSSCAAAAAAIRIRRCKSPVTVRMPGGEMLVEIDDDWNVRLTGTVARVCRGEWDADD